MFHRGVHRGFHAMVPGDCRGIAVAHQLTGTVFRFLLPGQPRLPRCAPLNKSHIAIQRHVLLIMTKLKSRGQNTVYSNKDACRQCPLRCTGGKGCKTVSFGPGVKAVPVRMYGKTDQKLNQLPEGVVLYNSFWRKDHARRQVILCIRPDPKKLKQRKCLSEHPFGTVKWYGGAHYLLCKGKEKTTGELGLSFLAYNLRRAINLVGIDALVKAM
jgi:transposase